MDDIIDPQPKEYPLGDRIKAILIDCFFKNEEMEDGKPIVPPIMVDGFTGKYGFHPERVARHKPEIIEILKLMPRAFFKDGGGGASFLHLCSTAAGQQWGEHTDCEALVVIAFAAGLGKFAVARPLWNNLPGGMPYIIFDLSETQPPCDTEERIH